MVIIYVASLISEYNVCFLFLQFALLITDGEQTRHRGAYVEPKVAATGLKRNGVHVFSLGISKYVSQKDLAAVASDKRSVFTTISFDDLEQVRSLIKSTICQGT